MMYPEEIVAKVNLFGLRGMKVIAIIPPQTATNDYCFVVEPYQPRSVTDVDLRS